jgi:hypothetical protein
MDIRYKIVSSFDQKIFTEEVERLLKAGWSCVGGLVMCGVIFKQAMMVNFSIRSN